jgi:hypothetical protein
VILATCLMWYPTEIIQLEEKLEGVDGVREIKVVFSRLECVARMTQGRMPLGTADIVFSTTGALIG